MRRAEIVAIWARVGGLLDRARAALPETTAPRAASKARRKSLRDFDEYAAANEWELAWDAVATVARATSAGPECWKLLAEAAELMALDDRAAAARSQARAAGGAPEPPAV